MNLYVLQELEILLGGRLTVKTYWRLSTAYDGAGFSFKSLADLEKYTKC